MSTDVTLFGSSAGLPAHISSAFSDMPTNIKPKDSIPSLSFRGKAWRMKIEGEETLLTRVVDGDAVPIPSIQVIVLGVHANRSRNYFEGAFVEGENKSPSCWSTNGVTPDMDVEKPIAASCASCPMSVKGSKVTESGKDITACATLRRLVVIPPSKLDMTPLLLKIPQTSMWDKDNKAAEAEGYYAWDQYTQFLRSRGVPHTAAVVTKIKFDSNATHPKLLFNAVSWVDDSKASKVKELVNSQIVKDLLEGTHNAEFVAAEPADNGFEQVSAEPVKTAPPPAAAKKKPAVAKPAPKVEVPDDDGFAEPVVTKAAEVVAEKPKLESVKAVVSGSTDLDALLGEWDDIEE